MPDASKWRRCPRGALLQLALDTKPRRGLVRFWLAGGLLAILMAAGVWGAASRLSDHAGLDLFNCRDVRPRMSRYLEGALPDDIVGHIQSHLDHCPECTEELKRQRLQRNNITRAPQRAASIAAGVPA